MKRTAANRKDTRDRARKEEKRLRAIGPGHCFAVTTGDYSSYGVQCVFIEVDDAIAYVKRVNEQAHREIHGQYVRDYRSFGHVGNYEDCPECAVRRVDLLNYEVRVEEFQLWQPGEMPAL